MEGLAVVLADVPASRVVEQLDAEADSARHHGDAARPHLETTHLRDEQQPTELRNKQQLTVRIDEHPAGHRPVGAIEMNADAELALDMSVAPDRPHPVDEVGRDIG